MEKTIAPRCCDDFVRTDVRTPYARARVRQVRTCRTVGTAVTC